MKCWKIKKKRKTMANWESSGYSACYGSNLNFKVKPGTKVRCEINTGEVWEGIVYYNQPHLIALNHAFEIKERRSRPGLKYILKNEFYSFEIVPDPNNPDQESDEENQGNKVPYTEFEKQIKNINRFVIFSKHNSDRIRRNLKRIIINKTTLGLYGIRLNDEESSPLGILALSTKDMVYIFDIRTLGYKLFDAGLRHVLESKDILKVVHNFEKFDRNLMEHHNVTLTNIFDVAMFENFLDSKETDDRNPLYDTLNKCLKVPLHMAIFTRDNLTVSIKNNKLNENFLYMIIFSVLFLIPLRNYFLKIKNKDFYIYNNKYAERSRARSPITALFVTRQDIFQEFEKLSLN